MNPSSVPANLSEIVTLLDPALVLFPRFGAAFLVLPLLKKGFVPRQLQVAFTLVLVLFAYPHITATMSVADWDTVRWTAFTVKEIVIGGLIGYTMGILLWAIAAMGELIDLQAGFQNAQIFNPFSGQSGGPFGAFTTQLGVLLFVSMGGLHVFLQLLYESLLLWPPGSFYPDFSRPLRDFAIGESGSMLEITTRLAAPVIGVLLLVELGIGLLNRAAQQLDTFYFSMPIKAAAAALVMALLLSHLVDVVRSDFGDSHSLLQKLDRSLRMR